MIGKLLKLYMAVEGLSVRDTAKAIGVSASTISRITSGKSIDAATMLKLINWLFAWEENRKSERYG